VEQCHQTLSSLRRYVPPSTLRFRPEADFECFRVDEAFADSPDRSGSLGELLPYNFPKRSRMSRSPRRESRLDRSVANVAPQFVERCELHVDVFGGVEFLRADRPRVARDEEMEVRVGVRGIDCKSPACSSCASLA